VAQVEANSDVVGQQQRLRADADLKGRHGAAHQEDLQEVLRLGVDQSQSEDAIGPQASPRDGGRQRQDHAAGQIERVAFGLDQRQAVVVLEEARNVAEVCLVTEPALAQHRHRHAQREGGAADGGFQIDDRGAAAELHAGKRHGEHVLGADGRRHRREHQRQQDDSVDGGRQHGAAVAV
jgi:hypothetical protein